MKAFIFYQVIFTFFVSSAAGQTYEWAINMGGSSADNGHSVATDSKGNVYVTGWTRGVADFDPSSSSHNLSFGGSQQVYIAKYSASGSLIWAKPISGNGWCQSNALVIDSADNVYITGWFDGTKDFDPFTSAGSISVTSSWDAYVAKYDSNGTYQWVFKLGGSTKNIGDGLCIGQDNHLYITGGYSSTVDFDPGSGTSNKTARGDYDIFVAKYTLGGQLVWNQSMGGTGTDFGRDVGVDGVGNVYVTGYFNGSANFSTDTSTLTLTSSGGSDIFLAKLDSNGSLLHARRMGGSGSDEGTEIFVESSGANFITGKFRNTVDFNPLYGTNNLSSNGSSDMFLGAYTDSLTYRWAHSVGGTGEDDGASITGNGNGNLFVTGRFSLSADFNPTSGTRILTSTGSIDYYVTSFATNGNFIWAHNFGSSSNDLGHDIHCAAGAKLYMIGYFHSTVDFNHTSATNNRTSSGSNDAFLHKLSVCQPYSKNEIAYFCPGNPYLFPDGSTTTLPKTHTSQFVKPDGCDSTIVTTLRSAKYDDTTRTNICLGSSYALPNKTLVNKPGTYPVNFQSAYGCDSNIVTILSINQTYDRKDTAWICEGDSAMLPKGTFVKVPGTYIDTFQTRLGCDSVITSRINLRNVQSTQSNVTLCFGDSHTLPDGSSASKTGTYETTLQSEFGCDSVHTTMIDTIPDLRKNETVNICFGDSTQLVDGRWVSIANTYSSPFTSVHGCDSTVKTLVNVTSIDNTISSNEGRLSSNESNGDKYRWVECESFSAFDTTRSITGVQGYYYYVVVEKNGCIDSSNCVMVGPNALKEEFFGTNGIHVFPNPFDHQINIQSRVKIESISAFEGSGKLVFQSTTNSNSIPTSKWSEGTYFIRINANGESGILKLIKSNN